MGGLIRKFSIPSSNRGARYIEGFLEFIAGSGIVKGSLVDKEVDEIKLKFTSLVKQIFFVETAK